MKRIRPPRDVSKPNYETPPIMVRTATMAELRAEREAAEADERQRQRSA